RPISAFATLHGVVVRGGQRVQREMAGAQREGEPGQGAGTQDLRAAAVAPAISIPPAALRRVMPALLMTAVAIASLGPPVLWVVLPLLSRLVHGHPLSARSARRHEL